MVDSSCISLQCDYPYVRPGDELLHIFSHHIGKSEDDLQEILRSKMIQHLTWLQQISEVLLREVNVSLEDYIDTMSTPGVPLDFVGLLFLSRIYHIHVAVFTTRGIWSTSRNVKKHGCLFGVVFNGNFKFTETVKVGRGNQYRAWLTDRTEKGKMPSHAKTSLPAEIKIEGTLCSLPDALDIVNNNVICGHRQREQNEDGDKYLMHLEKVKKEFGIPDFNKLVKPKLKNCGTVPANDLQPLHVHDTEGDVSNVKHEAAQVSRLSCVKNEDGAETSDDDCEVIKCDETLPYSDTEIDTLWEDVSRTVSKAQAAVGVSTGELGGSTAQAEVGAVPPEEEIVIDDDLLLTCPMCFHQETTQKACIEHIDRFHPEYRYPCRHCDKYFNSFHTRYRHEQGHGDQKHICADCGAGYPYLSELTRHAAVHNTVLPYPCTRCEKRFAQKKSLKRHEVLHDETTFKCNFCDKVCESKDRLYSHQRGAHGKGYTSKCGKFNFPWPAGRARHALVCDKCKEIIQAEQAAKRKQTVLKKLKTEHVKTEHVKMQNVKTEHSNTSLEDVKERVQCKIENIIRLKQDL